MIVDGPVELSRSMLWRMQRHLYVDRGKRSWTEGTLPSLAVCNAFIARQYAEIIIALMEDMAATAARIPAEVQPLTVVEWASGTGRFGYYVIRAVATHLELVGGPRVPFRYVFTDLGELGISEIQGHPELQPWIEAGMVDFALFDADMPSPLELRISGDVIGPGFDLPVLAIGNYFFDSIRSDAWHVGPDGLQKALVVLEAADPVEPHDPGGLERLKISHRLTEPTEPDYADARWNDILTEFAEEMPNESALFLVPTAAGACVEWLDDVSGGQWVLLASDKGFLDIEQFGGNDNLGIQPHDGCFSVSVNFDALDRFATALGAETNAANARVSELNTVMYTRGFGRFRARRVARAFDRALVFGLSPAGFLTLMQQLTDPKIETTLVEMLSLLDLSEWDPGVFSRISARLAPALTGARTPVRASVLASMKRVWQQAYTLPGDGFEVALGIAAVHHAAGQYTTAVDWYDKALEISGESPDILLNRAGVYYVLGLHDKAEADLRRVLDLDPRHKTARERLEALRRG